MHHGLTVEETPRAVDQPGSVRRPDPRRIYIAVRALLKRGQQYQPGDPIALDPTTARHFLAAGDIKESR